MLDLDLDKQLVGNLAVPMTSYSAYRNANDDLYQLLTKALRLQRQEEPERAPASLWRRLRSLRWFEQLRQLDGFELLA
jgi:hypothetical protein